MIKIGTRAKGVLRLENNTKNAYTNWVVQCILKPGQDIFYCNHFVISKNDNVVTLTPDNIIQNFKPNISLSEDYSCLGHPSDFHFIFVDLSKPQPTPKPKPKPSKYTYSQFSSVTTGTRGSFVPIYNSYAAVHKGTVNTGKTYVYNPFVSVTKKKK